ncbi:MAG: peptidase family protein [Actinomycetia bacterium]|nr:peptidase family protein [Actinomycetes bacterium]
MFPLGTVLFPYGLLPLHVFEPRYRAMMRDCAREDHEFGVVLIERGSEVGGGDVRFSIGTLARIVQIAELDDGGYALRAVGVRRLRVDAWLPEDPYPVAEVAELVEPELSAPDEAIAHAIRDRVQDALVRLFALWSQFDARASEIDVALAPDAVQASFEAAALAPMGPLDAQRVLEAGNAADRLASVEHWIADEIELLESRGHD